jgi:hypothetical protein
MSQWPPIGVSTQKADLLRLASAIRDRPEARSDDEQIWLTRFFIIRQVGFLEQAVKEILKGYVRGTSGGPTRAFALSFLERSKNPSPENLVETVGRFDATMAGNLDDWLQSDDQKIYRDISLVVSRRHLIAHGQNEGMGSLRALQLCTSVCEVVDWFIDEFRSRN